MYQLTTNDFYFSTDLGNADRNLKIVESFIILKIDEMVVGCKLLEG